MRIMKLKIKRICLCPGSSARYSSTRRARIDSKMYSVTIAYFRFFPSSVQKSNKNNEILWSTRQVGEAGWRTDCLAKTIDTKSILVLSAAAVMRQKYGICLIKLFFNWTVFVFSLIWLPFFLFSILPFSYSFVLRAFGGHFVIGIVHTWPIIRLRKRILDNFS